MKGRSTKPKWHGIGVVPYCFLTGEGINYHNGEHVHSGEATEPASLVRSC
jgi:hypothetical protein